MRDETHTQDAEIVEVYRQKEYREVVERYMRPLPESMDAFDEDEELEELLTDLLHTGRRRRRWPKWLLLAALLVLAGLAGFAASYALDWFYPPQDYYHYDERDNDHGGEITIPTFPYGQGAQLRVDRDRAQELTIQEIYRQVNPSVVAVLARTEGGYSVGTGVIFTEDGYILTNHHVVSGASECTVALAGYGRAEALYVAGDAENDLAVLKLDLTELPAASFGDSDDLVVGDPVYAIGNPLGIELRNTLTDGIVSAIDRDVQVDGRTMTLIQTNAALNSGNSGGPLIDRYGQVVGINVIKMSSRYSNVEGLGFAIPSASVDRIVNDLLTFGEVKPEPLLGVSVLHTATMLEEGVCGIEVVEVVKDSAADRAGILLGDYILSAGGEPITTSRELLRVRRHYHAGDTLPVTLWRNGEVIEVALKLEKVVQ